MPTDSGNARPKRGAGGAPIVLAALLLLIALGSVTLLVLGRPLPQEAGSDAAQVAWGDRVERRLDAFIERVRPSWADRVEARMEAFADRIGWD
jgi:hypothetical protein